MPNYITIHSWPECDYLHPLLFSGTLSVGSTCNVVGLLTANNGLMMPGDKKIILDNSGQYLQADTSTTVLLNSVAVTQFGIGGSVEMSLQANGLFFTPASDPIAFDWTVTDELALKITGVDNLRFTASATYPGTDNTIDLGRATTNWFKDIYAKRIYLGAVTEYIYSSFGTVLDLNAGVGIQFRIATTAVVTLAPTVFKPTGTDVTDSGDTGSRWNGSYSQSINASHSTNPSALVANLWYNEAEAAYRIETDQGLGDLTSTLAVALSASLVENTSTETAFATTHTIPANSLADGKVFKLYAAGVLTTDGTITYTLRLKLGSLVILTGNVSQTANTDGAWFFEGTFTVRDISLGTVTIATNGSMGLPRDEYKNLANAAVSTFAEGSSHVLQLTVQMSAAGAGKKIATQQLIIQEAA